MATIMKQPPQEHQTYCCNTYDHQKEIREFDESKLGAKGLVDLGITELPRIFHHAPEHRIPVPDLNSDSDSGPIPVIDLLGPPREEVVEKVREACSKYGFFQVVNHGIPLSLLCRQVDAIKAFHEQPTEVRKGYYDRGTSTGCNYFSNVDLFVSEAASWRDTLQVKLGPSIIDPQVIPAICRNEVIEWDKEVKQLGELLLGLFSEGLGLASVDRLKELSCLESRLTAGHYYPYCPEPEKTAGVTSHSDPVVFTVLLQDQVGGLQFKHQGKWVDVKPIPGALVINVGDLLQIMSNGKYTSADHRVYANPLQEPRVSIAVLFNPGNREDIYGPLPELVSPEEPALYREFTLTEFLIRWFTKGLVSDYLVNSFRIKNE